MLAKKIFTEILPHMDALDKDIGNYIAKNSPQITDSERDKKINGMKMAIARDIGQNYKVWKEFFGEDGNIKDPDAVAQLFELLANDDLKNFVNSWAQDLKLSPRQADALKMSMVRDEITKRIEEQRTPPQS